MPEYKKADTREPFEDVKGELAALMDKYTHVNRMIARQNFSDVTNMAGVHNRRVILTNRNDPFAVIAPLEDLKILDALEDLGVRDVQSLYELLDKRKVLMSRPKQGIKRAG